MKDEDGLMPAAQEQADASEGRLARWSRRKREASNTAEVAPPITREANDQNSDDESHADPQLTDADMPPIESLTEDSDYSAFLSPKVSEALRQQALRKLFGLHNFNVCDGLDDYAEDFTNFPGLGDIVTHEMRRMLEKQTEKLKEAIVDMEDPSTPQEHATTTKPPVETEQAPDQASITSPDAEHQIDTSNTPGDREKKAHS